MLLNLSKDGLIMSKDNFGVSHSLSYDSLNSSKGLGCSHEIANIDQDGKKILSSDMNRCHWW